MNQEKPCEQSLEHVIGSPAFARAIKRMHHQWRRNNECSIDIYQELFSNRFSLKFCIGRTDRMGDILGAFSTDSIELADTLDNEEGCLLLDMHSHTRNSKTESWKEYLKNQRFPSDGDIDGYSSYRESLVRGYNPGRSFNILEESYRIMPTFGIALFDQESNARLTLWQPGLAWWLSPEQYQKLADDPTIKEFRRTGKFALCTLKKKDNYNLKKSEAKKLTQFAYVPREHHK